MTEKTENYITAFKSYLDSYAPISETSWLKVVSISQFKTLKKGEVLLQEGTTAKNIYYICKGALRAYFSDMDGNSYNKNLFMEGNIAASTASLLEQTPSKFTLEALEDCILLYAPYKKYRELIFENEDLKRYYIAYLEKIWVIEKEQREISLVMENATVRYQKLLQKHPDIDRRITKLHIASHLGITPTQLSRIRKNLKK
ncbi:Crp/Fnr family transcriptional regulator [Parapedobacter tibetensis]|uniref:Crp/Fnr family transcriptional regulator n=1 Tax=Parapedobacter tibetensis TaxID=2972951 RepID=UPI00214DA54F|nr:Crp/Fnr family transcriptional regulator [Parapedobacter tibetensis]